MTFLYMCVWDYFSSLMGPYGTKGQWSWLLGKTRPGPMAKHLKRRTRKRKWAVAPKRPGGCATQCPSYTLSVCVGFLVVCCFVRSAWNGPGWTEVSVRIHHIHLFFMKYGWVRSMLAIFLNPCPLRRSISTVDRFFWYEGTSTVDIDRFFLVWIHIDGRFRPIFCSNRRSMRYQLYFQVGESASTVDIDRILK